MPAHRVTTTAHANEYLMLWSYALTAVGLLGLWLAGKKNRIGWAIGIVAQALWMTYAIVTSQWGFIIGSVCYGAIYVRNWFLWRHSSG